MCNVCSCAESVVPLNCVCRRQYVDPWDESSHRHTRYDAKTHTVVSPAAAQLVQTLTTINSPPPPLEKTPASLVPHPQGTHSVAGHSATGREPETGALRGGGNMRRGFIKEKKPGEEGQRWGCDISRSLSYTKAPRVLSPWRRRQD